MTTRSPDSTPCAFSTLAKRQTSACSSRYDTCRTSPGSPTKVTAVLWPRSSRCTSRQLYETFSSPSTNQPGLGARDSCSVTLKGLCQRNSSCAWRAQNPLWLAVASALSAAISCASRRARAVNSGAGGKRRSSTRTDSIFWLVTARECKPKCPLDSLNDSVEPGRRHMRKQWMALLVLGLPAAMAPMIAHGDDCHFKADRAGGVDAKGVEKVVIRAGAGDLKVVGRTNAIRIEARGVACAGKQELLDATQLSVRREGNTVYVETTLPQDDSNWSWGNKNYAYIDTGIALPANLPVDAIDSSGDAVFEDLKSLVLQDSSGDLRV